MTDAELTILGLLSEGPRYGHEIQHLIDERGLREWLAIGFSSVFYILNKFERQNMVESELRPGARGAARKRYVLTDAGYGILQTAIADLLRRPRSLGSGFELGLANLYALKPVQVYRVLTYHLEDLQRQLEAVEASWAIHQQDDDDTKAHIRALYTHSISLMQADLAWLNTFLADWVARYPGVEEDAARIGIDPNDPHQAATALHRAETPDPLKMIQRLKPVPPPPPDNQG